MARLSSFRTARENLVDSTVFRLHVFDLHDVLEAVDGAPKVDFPDGGVGLVAIFARMDRPFSEKGGVAIFAVAPLLGVDPRHAEDGFVRVDPLQAVESARINHANDPVSHPLRPFVVDFSIPFRNAGDRRRFVYDRRTSCRRHFFLFSLAK